MCSCVRMCTCAQHWASSSISLHCILWNTVSHWIWRSLTQLGWLASKFQGPSHLHIPARGLQVLIFKNSDDPNSSLYTLGQALYQQSHPPPASLSGMSEVCLWDFVFLGTNRGFHGTGSRSKFVGEITLLLGFLLTRTRKWVRNSNEIWAWRCMPAILVLRSQGRRDSKFKGSLLCTVSFRMARAS